MDKVVMYIHGKGGDAEEAAHYRSIFTGCDVVGFDYTAQFPWEAEEEFPMLFDRIRRHYESVQIIANSIGAYFVMDALSDKRIEKAYFISPIVNMEQLIVDMMSWAGVAEDELRDKREIRTAFGETLSWEYLCYVRENPIVWKTPTDILFGEKDNLTSYATISAFAKRTNATLTVMRNGEHWFHTEEQTEFLDEWISRSAGCISV